VEAAREAANDNVTYLQQLRRYLDKLNMLDEFIALVPLFKPVMHTMLLIWKHSKYYNTSARFVTLLQEICNDLIMQVGALQPWVTTSRHGVQDHTRSPHHLFSVLRPEG
jgi:dynein heavy chain